jgi:cytochrome c oxidase cbb3-type subunit III
MNRVVIIPLSLLLLAGCEREERRFREAPPAASPPRIVSLSPLQPGPTVLVNTVRGPYEYNAYAMSEGKLLFDQFNCSGCHAHGGGGMGPPLMDDEWIYGSQPENIFQTIIQGRPNGMPAFRERLSNDQVWRLVAYVQSMSGQLSKDAEPTRSDNMSYRPSEQRTKEEKPKGSFTPGPAER